MGILVAWIACHAGGDIGYGIPGPMAGQTLLGKRIQFFLKGHLARTVLIEHANELRGDIGNQSVATLEMLIGHYLVA